MHPDPKICLNMIVKNEAHVIERCLASLRGFVDYWVIVDTGSTDGTQQKIRDLMSGVPGELMERPWVDFAHNRSEALEYAREKGEYVFILDADEVLVRKPGFELPALDKDAYLVEMVSGGVSYHKTQLVNNRLNWCYKGVLHEYLYCNREITEGILPNAAIYRYTDGARSRDRLTYKKDALVLERALLEEPGNARYVFYLAQSYRDAQEPELAIKNYQRRVALGGWIEEVWYSLYQIAEVKQRMEKPWAEVLEAYLAAFEYYPKRREPLFKAAMHYQNERKHNGANLLLARCMEIPFPADDRLFVERILYDYMTALEYAVSCYWVGDQAEAIRVNNELLNVGGLPGAIFDRVLKNRRFSLDAIHPRKKQGAVKVNRIKVCVLLRDPGTFLDNCIESLLSQDYGCYEMVFIDEGSTDDAASRVPVEDPRVTLIRNETPRGAAALYRFLTEHCAPRDIAVYVSGCDWLAHRGVLTAINEFYETRECSLMYGQYRYSTGNYGFALPFPDRDSFNDPNREWYWPDIRTHRAGLFSTVREQYPNLAFLKDETGEWLTAESEDALFDIMMDAAGFEHACFNDEVLYIRNSECAPEVAPGGSPVKRRRPRPRAPILSVARGA
jgi:glycosyltransferase involved in cell wall biosynthesis